ncbi:hypothetical protein LguiA_008156 [Lonicera macranthoides]
MNCFVKDTTSRHVCQCWSIETANKIFNELDSRRNSVTWNSMSSRGLLIGWTPSQKLNGTPFLAHMLQL